LAIVGQQPFSYLGGGDWDFHCARKFFSEPSSVKILLSHEKESKKKIFIPSVVGFIRNIFFQLQSKI
jgi:hypothetical protein